MPSALANRFVHIDFEVDMEDWYTWATLNGISDITRAFIRFRPNLLHSFDPAANERAFPTPRSWAFVDDVTQSNLDHDTEYELICGTVGKGAGAEYLAFSRLAKELPSSDEILLTPDSAPVPESPAAQYAVCAMLDQKATKSNLGRLISYVSRMSAEYEVLFMRSAVMRDRTLVQSKDYVSWAIKNQDVVLMR